MRFSRFPRRTTLPVTAALLLCACGSRNPDSLVGKDIDMNAVVEADGGGENGTIDTGAGNSSAAAAVAAGMAGNAAAVAPPAPGAQPRASAAQAAQSPPSPTTNVAEPASAEPAPDQKPSDDPTVTATSTANTD